MIEIIGFVLFAAAAAGVMMLKILMIRLDLGQAYFWLCAAMELFFLLAGWYLYRLSVRMLERGYDLG